MGKYQNELGFTAVEGLLIVLILAVIGFGGYYVWHTQHSKKASTPTTSALRKKATSTTPPNPYAGWKTATLQYDKIMYQYPSSWTVTDKSVTYGCVTPGSDDIYLTSPSNEQIELRTGVSCIGDGGAVTFGSAIPVESLGQKLYIAFEDWAGEGSPGPTTPQFACLARTSSPNTPLDFVSKNIFLNDSSSSDKSTNSSFCYYPYNQLTVQSADQLPTESVSSIENSTDFATAKLIFESMHY